MNSPAVIIAGRLATMAMALATAPIIAREIGPEGRGLVAAAMVTAALIPLVVGLGVPLGVRVLTAREGSTSAARSGRVFAWLTLPACLLLGALARLSFLRDLPPGPTLAFLGYAAAGALFVHALSDQSVLIVRREYFRIAVLQSSQIAVATAVILALWPAGLVTVSAVLWAQAAGTVAAFVCGLVYVRNLDPGGSWREVLTLARSSLRYAGGQIAEVAALKADQMLMLPIIGAVQAGFYAVAATVASIPVVVAHALGAIYFRLFADEDEATIGRFAIRVIRTSWLSGALIALPLAVVTPWLVPLLFGAEFEPATVPTLIALAMAPALVANYVGSQALTARGRGHLMTTAQVVGLGVGLGALFALGPRYGAEGAAVASGVGYLLTLLVLAFAHARSPLAWVPRPSDVSALWREARAR